MTVESVVEMRLALGWSVENTGGTIYTVESMASELIELKNEKHKVHQVRC